MIVRQEYPGYTNFIGKLKVGTFTELVTTQIKKYDYPEA